ncbi:unnamed protein product [Arabidopsis halleri]
MCHLNNSIFSNFKKSQKDRRANFFVSSNSKTIDRRYFPVDLASVKFSIIRHSPEVMNLYSLFTCCFLIVAWIKVPCKTKK